METEHDAQAQPETEGGTLRHDMALAKSNPQALQTALENPKMAVALARANETNQALEPAYAQASLLKLTKDEELGLSEPFTEDDVEIRPHDGLLYIPHIVISERLNRVLGQGQWCMIRRREFCEGDNIYSEWVMKIRGCYIGESIGAQAYQRNNPKSNYSDALEGTRGEALRRIAGKDLSCGSQVWRPGYCRDWIKDNATPVWCINRRTGEKKKMWRKNDEDPIDIYPWAEEGHGYKAPETRPAAPRTSRAAEPAPAPVPTPPADPGAYAEQDGVFTEPGEGEPLPVAPPEPTAEDESWRQAVIHFGKWRGTPLGKLPKGSLAWFCTDWQPKPFKGQISREDKALRRALDAAKEHYKFKPRQHQEDTFDSQDLPAPGEASASSDWPDELPGN